MVRRSPDRREGLKASFIRLVGLPVNFRRRAYSVDRPTGRSKGTCDVDLQVAG